MAERNEDRADALFRALAANYDMSFAAVQKHVAVLEKAGLLTKRRSGREQLASGDVEAVRSVACMLTELEQRWLSLLRLCECWSGVNWNRTELGLV